MNKYFPLLVTAQYPLAILATLMDFLGVSKELKETREAVTKAADAMALAVPGERYQRLIDAVHKGTPEEQKKAKEFIKSVFKIDVDASYTISVNFSFDTSSKTKLRADIFAGHSPYAEEVKLYTAYTLNPDPPVSSNVLTPMSDGEIWTAIQKIYQRDLQGLYGSGQGLSVRPPPSGFVIQPAARVIGCENDEGLPQQLVNDLTSAIWTLRGERPLPLTPGRSIPYFPFSELDYLFVLINKEDFDKVTVGKSGDSFQVKIKAHETAHPDKPLPFVDNRPFVLRKADFLLPDHQVESDTNGTFVWAVRQVTQFQGISEQYLKKLQDLRGLTQKYDKQ